MTTIPSLPSELVPLPFFKQRLRELGFVEGRSPSGGGSYATYVSDGLRFRLNHSGYGGGHGGERPVRVLGYDIEFPHAARGTLVADDVAARIGGLLRALLADAPAVHAYHPDALRSRLVAFFDELAAQRYRVVIASRALADLDLSGATPRDRLAVYGRAVGERDVTVLTAPMGRDYGGACVFRGSGDALATRAAEIATQLGDVAYSVRVGDDGNVLFVDDAMRLVGNRDFCGKLAIRISAGKREGASVRVEVDAEPGETAWVVASSDDAAAIRARLEALTRASRASTFTITVDGRATEVKKSKLPAMASALRAEVGRGRRVEVGGVGASARAAASLVW